MSYMRVTESRLDQARRVAAIIARDGGPAEMMRAARQIMVAWMEGRHIEREIAVAIDGFDSQHSRI